MHSPWPSMRQNPQNTGSTTLSVDELHDAHASAIATKGLIFPTPVIDDREVIYAGSSDHTFYAYDTRTQRVLWSIETKEVIDSAAAIHPNGTILFPSGDGKIYCCSKDGEILWTFDVTQHRSRARYTFATSYWWEGNIAIDPDGYIYAGNDDFFLYCITPEGKLKWAFRTDLFIWATVAFGEPDMVYASSFDGSVYAIERSTGKLAWKTDTKNPLIASPAIAGDMLIQCTLGGTMQALHRVTGKRLWSIPIPRHVYASPLLTPDNKVITASSTGDILAFDIATQTLAWSWKELSVMRSSLVAGEDPEKKSPYLIYGGNGNGELFALDATGHLRWRLPTAPGGIDPQKHVINGSLALGSHGIAAPVGRYLYYIPYTQYKKASSLPPLPEHKKTYAGAGDIQAADTLLLNNIHITTPTIIPTLDQIGLQSLRLSLTIVDRDATQGIFLAYGSLVFGHDEAGQLVGVPRSQTYSFAFHGTITDHGVILETKNIYFETSGFPFPLDVLTITSDGLTSDTNATLHARVIERGSLRTFGAVVLAHISANPPQGVLKSITHIHDIPYILYAWIRLLKIAAIFFIRQYWNDWDLFDTKGSIHMSGMAALTPRAASSASAAWKLQSHTYRPASGILTIRLAALQPHTPSNNLACIIGDSTLQPIPINYSRDVKKRRHADGLVTLSINVPEHMRIDKTLTAYILDGTVRIGTIGL